MGQRAVSRLGAPRRWGSLLDEGETRGGADHGATIAGQQPEGVELAQAFVAAELVHWGRLNSVTLKAQAAPGAVAEVRESARVGRRAVWTTTLGDALTAALADLLRRERLSITVASGPLPLAAFDEVRQMVLTEWAHRLAGDKSLSMPAACFSGLIPDRNVDLSIEWRDGDSVPLRVVRGLHYESIALDSARSLSAGLTGHVRRQVFAGL